MHRILDTYPAHFHNEKPARIEDITEIQDMDTGDLLCYAPDATATRIIAAVDACQFFTRDPIEVIGRVHALLAAVRLKLTDRDCEDLGIAELDEALGMNPALPLAA